MIAVLFQVQQVSISIRAQHRPRSGGGGLIEVTDCATTQPTSSRGDYNMGEEAVVHDGDAGPSVVNSDAMMEVPLSSSITLPKNNNSSHKPCTM